MSAVKRLRPHVRVLIGRIRRPAKMIFAGLVLMAPAGGLMLQRRVTEARQADIRERVQAAKAVDGPIAQAWRIRAEEKVLESDAERLAARFRIPSQLARQIHRAAREESVDPVVAFGLVRAESSFRRHVVSYAGAVGYTQLLPSTARWIVPGTSRQDLFEPETNLRVGFRYLNYLLDKYDGDMRLALTAYNRGPGTVDRLVKRGRNPENGYADKVLRVPRSVTMTE